MIRSAVPDHNLDQVRDEAPVKDERRRRAFQFSIRTLLLVTAASALLLVPVAWVARERQQMLQARLEILTAREVALRSFVREHESRQQHLSARSSQPAPAKTDELEDIRRENAGLKEQVKQLRNELERLKSEVRPAGLPNR